LLAPSELWRFRELAVQPAGRDITVRYRQTVLGALWAVLQQVAAVVVFSIFFGRLAHLSSEGHAYAVFSLARLVPWTFFANGPLLGSDSLVANSALVAKTYFPRMFIPLSLACAGGGVRRRRAVPDVIDKAAVLCVRLARNHPLPGFRSITGCTGTRCLGSRRNRDRGDVINVEGAQGRGAR
jgi:hypothetical protein